MSSLADATPTVFELSNVDPDAPAGHPLRGWYGAAILLILGLGVVLRLRAYLANRSLWLDEALLALNIMQRDYGALLTSLDDAQVAPVGFLFAERLISTLFGSSEYALRALPLVAAVCALFMFWKLASQLLPPVGTVLAVAIFAISEPLIYYAAEVKQYSVDVAITVLLWWICTMLSSRLDRDDLVAWALVTVLGAVAIWSSHPAIFVVGGIAAYAVCDAVRGGRWKSLFVRGSASTIWVGSFVAFYLISLRFIHSRLYDAWYGTAQGAVQGATQGAAQGAAHSVAIAPVTFVLQRVGQYREALWTLAGLPLGSRVVQLVTLSVILGVIALWRRPRRQYAWFGVTVILVTLASNLQKYPIAARLWLFLAPVMVLLVAAGLDELWRRTRPTFPVLAPLLACLVLFYPVAAGARAALWPAQKEEVRPLLAHLRQRYREGDILYVYRFADGAARYYAARGLGFPGDVVRETDVTDWLPQAERNVAALRGRARVWVLIAHVDKYDDVDEDILLLRVLDRVGVRLESTGAPGASLYLYDLSRRP